ncbi:MAG: hypothetical protein CBC25_01100 [Pelagibacteraceae bacterium TMED65]|nr:MAG: hypothetical protein CBC25_01100 [Pelagibacteraceae bacterium TMED65]|tara:strand:+ start:54 stop:1721 length:1668 start_codon:yes stop_codon:yes gene_type:complete
MSLESDADFVVFDRRNKWLKFSLSGAVFFIVGSASESQCKTLIEKLSKVEKKEFVKTFTGWLKSVAGHFGIICVFKKVVLAATDRVGSFQVFIAKNASGWRIGNHAADLAEVAGLCELDGEGLLSLSMSGYVIGKRSVLTNFSVLQAGEAVILNQTKLDRWYYHKFLPVEPTQFRSEGYWLKKLSDTTLKVLDDLKQKANGRQIVIPLSAGLDSRLVLSGLTHLKTDNVLTFSYGHPNNFEAMIAKKIAQKLGVEWHFVPITASSQGDFFKSSLHNDYITYCHDFISTPFEQDLHPVNLLLSSDVIKRDALIVNGNSGDFITGGHIPPNFLQDDLVGQEKVCQFTQTFMEKHFNLWENKFSQEDKARVVSLLSASLADEGLLKDPNIASFTMWERLEFLNRQSKYVISGQRVYDFLELDWALPLWSDEYLKFWAGVPLSLKINQNLYKKMLKKNNWGGVWDTTPTNQRVISPSWIIPLRFAFKLIFFPFGKIAWHKFEKRFFSYWMDLVHNYSVQPYHLTIFRKSLARNAISFHTENYENFVKMEICKSQFSRIE